ncbi:MAG TPA: M81 family metallopeptidase, partial [Thermomicrobiales bacterium]|nr:M81 family metallopeptidase [Thermomicrobiales bacterium]
MRVAIGGISHETNTFSSIRTDIGHFQRRMLLRGPTLIAASRGAGNALGGVVDTALALGWELVPTIFASATPSGRIRRGVFESLTKELADGIGAARPLDGVLLALHGAMAAEALDDADGELLRRVRHTVGPETPIVVTLDFHANLTPTMAQHADIILAYETYPHLDTYARGADAALLLQRLRRGEIRPVHALRQIPMLTPLPAQSTEGQTAMRDLARQAQDLRGTPGIIALTLTPGFPYSDIHDAGLAVLATADGDAALAEETAGRLATACWDRREDFHAILMGVEEAVAVAMTAPAGPVVLADVSDNPSAGGSGDGTVILAELIRARASGAALATIADAQAVARGTALGAGGSGIFRLGGKVDRLHGPTLDVSARVRWVGDCRFTNSGPMGAGSLTRLGQTALLEFGDGQVEVIVCQHRVQVLDPALFRAVGIEPLQRRILVVKSSVHYRAAFESLAARVIDVDGPGLSSPDLSRFAYRRVRRPMWPLEPL